MNPKLDAILGGVTPKPATITSPPRLDAALRRARWVALCFVLLQFGLYPAPPEAPRLAGWAGAAVFAGTLIAVNLLSARADRFTARARRAVGAAALGADMALVLAAIWIFAYERSWVLWPILVLPVAEAAFHNGRRGALAAWAVSFSVYCAIAVGTEPLGDPLNAVKTLTYRGGIVLIVALVTGYLTDHLMREVAAQQRARLEQERRAGLLRQLAEVSRVLSATDTDGVLAAVADAALELGFEATNVCLLDDDGYSYAASASRGSPAQLTAHRPAGRGLAGAVVESRDTVVCDDYSRSPWAVDELREHFRGFAAVASPIWEAETLRAVLVAGRRGGPLSPEEVESAELLAGQASAAFDTASRIAERQTFERALAHQANHDPLTGLPNRALFDERLARAVGALRHDRPGLAVVFVDVDRFKVVNDSLGHGAGDQLLRGLCTRMSSLVRPGDLLARFGGDEFVVLCEGVRNDAEATRIAERLSLAADDPIDLGGVFHHITVSIGIAFADQPGVEPAALLRDADAAMYRAKERGRNRYELFDADLRATAVARLDTELALRRAVEQGELRVEYQPIISVREGHLVGAEALVRWQHPTRGLLLPDDFLDIAEETGVISEIGEWVLREVCNDLASWQGSLAHVRDLSIGVNLSARQVAQPGLIDFLRARVDEAGIDPGMLTLEITESVLAEDIAATRDALLGLKALGVRIAIDDFGTGFSSLAYLKEFPVDVLKIDRSFIAGIQQDPRDAAIVIAVIQLAYALGLATVAEGVETPQQEAAIRQLGCHRGQGYWYGPPQSARGFQARFLAGVNRLPA